MGGLPHAPGGCFINVSRALQDIPSRFCIAEIVLLMRISSWKFVRVPKNSHHCECWTPFQYPIRRLTVRSRKVSKSRDLYLELSDRCEIWQAPRQQGCRSACQISKRCDNLNYQSRGLDTSRDLTIRRLIGYWNGALVLYIFVRLFWRAREPLVKQPQITYNQTTKRGSMKFGACNIKMVTENKLWFIHSVEWCSGRLVYPTSPSLFIDITHALLNTHDKHINIGDSLVIPNNTESKFKQQRFRWSTMNISKHPQYFADHPGIRHLPN